MSLQLNAYLSFGDKTREAMEFYKTVFGGTLTLQTFKEGGMPCEPQDEGKIMHAVLNGDNGITFFASDTPSGVTVHTGSSISMALSGDPEEEETLTGYWNKLSEGGTVTMPFEVAPWGDKFGMVTDKFGTAWMVDVGAKKEA
jgi:PhnB protein